MSAFIRGIGYTKVREAWDKGVADLAIEAVQKTLRDAKMEKEDIDKIYVSNALVDILQHQGNLGSKISSDLGFQGKRVTNIRNGGASGGMAINLASEAVKGVSDNVLVLGVEKPKDALWADLLQADVQEEGWEYLGGQGITSAALEALLLRLYMNRFDVKHEEIAKITEISQEHASTAPHAAYPFPISVEKVMKSPIVADPLRLFELAGIGDGAAAAVISSEEGDVEISASEVCTGKFRPFERGDPLVLEGVRKASRKAYKKTGVSQSNIDLAEIHDTSSIMGVLELEALGLAEKGKGYKELMTDKFTLRGETPINSFGGLKGRGHPIGATGIYQVAEATQQLRGKGRKNQVEDPQLALTLSMGGSGRQAVVNLIRRRGEANA